MPETEINSTNRFLSTWSAAVRYKTWSSGTKQNHWSVKEEASHVKC